MEKYDVVIVGAGPAGLSAAKVLAEHDREVLVLEKNGRIGDKVCAGLIDLKKINIKIPNSILERKFRYFKIKSPLQEFKADIGGKFLGTIDRKILGKYMAKQAIKEGAKIWKEVNVKNISKNFVVLNNNKKIGFDYLIGADGANSIVRRFLNLKNEKLADAFQYRFKGKKRELEFHFDPLKLGPGYLWVFPYKDSFSIGSGGDLSRHKIININDVRQYLEEYCKENRFDIKNAKFEGTIINYDYKGHEFNNIFLAGDAAGLTPGLICDGINPAITSGMDIAKKILDKKYNCENIYRILRIKKVEEDILSSLEISKTLTEIEVEALVSLLRLKLINKFVLDELE